jgi:CRISPR-associated endonuclease Cas1
MQQLDSTFPLPPLQVRAGLLVVDGYGISLRVLYGKLHVEDGIADRRRSIVLDRAGSGLERLVLLGKTGSITLEALAWLRAIGAALVHLAPDGALLAHSVPFGYDGHPIRRAQALATVTGLDVDLARDLIQRKLDGQRKNLVRLRVHDLHAFDGLREALDRAGTINEVRLCEAKAAAIYWNAWANIPLNVRGRDLARLPARWARYESRASILTGAPRAATNPVNALLNYLYSLLESESRLALLAAGCDPTLGVLHSDQRNRDSFALDAMEPIRPDVDAFVLDLLEAHVFTSREFVELPNGVCRIRAPLTHDLALTLPRWRLLVSPVVAHLAHAFRQALRDRSDTGTAPRALNRTRSSGRPAALAPRPTSAQSTLTGTPRKRAGARPYASKAWRAPRPEPLALIPVACASCGKPVLKRRRRYCEVCMPRARRTHGERAITTARAALAAQVSKGIDPRASAHANTQRGEANASHHRRNRQWAKEHPGPRDRAWFLREVAPKLDAFSLGEIAKVTGLSLAACSRFRAGARVPHPRHWEAFLALVEGS